MSTSALPRGRSAREPPLSATSPRVLGGLAKADAASRQRPWRRRGTHGTEKFAPPGAEWCGVTRQSLTSAVFFGPWRNNRATQRRPHATHRVKPNEVGQECNVLALWRSWHQPTLSPTLRGTPCGLSALHINAVEQTCNVLAIWKSWHQPTLSSTSPGTRSGPALRHRLAHLLRRRGGGGRRRYPLDGECSCLRPPSAAQCYPGKASRHCCSTTTHLSSCAKLPPG